MSVQETINAAKERAKSVEGKASRDTCSRLERSFLVHYLPGCDGTKAARAIGRGGKHPDRWASKVVKRPWVRAEIERRLAALEASQAGTMEALVDEYRKLAFQPYEGSWLASHKIQTMRDYANIRGWLKPDVAVQTNVSFSFVGSPRHASAAPADPAQVIEAVPMVDKPEPR